MACEFRMRGLICSERVLKAREARFRMIESLEGRRVFPQNERTATTGKHGALHALIRDGKATAVRW